MRQLGQTLRLTKRKPLFLMLACPSPPPRCCRVTILDRLGQLVMGESLCGPRQWLLDMQALARLGQTSACAPSACRGWRCAGACMTLAVLPCLKFLKLSPGMVCRRGGGLSVGVCKRGRRPQADLAPRGQWLQQDRRPARQRWGPCPRQGRQRCGHLWAAEAASRPWHLQPDAASCVTGVGQGKNWASDWNGNQGQKELGKVGGVWVWTVSPQGSPNTESRPPRTETTRHVVSCSFGRHT